jgi:hypothetical protein
VQQKALLAVFAGPYRPQPFDRLVAGPGQFTGVFQQQVGAGLLQGRQHALAMPHLQIVGSGFGQPEEPVSRFDIITMGKQLGDAFSGAGSHRLGDGLDPLHPTDV